MRMLSTLLITTLTAGYVSAAETQPAATTAPAMTRPAEAAAGEKEPLPPQLQGVGIDQKLGDTIPLDTVLRDSTGKEVKLREFFDGRRPVILTLVYYKCPMLCTLVLNDLLRSMRAMSELTMGKDFQVVTVSFNPREGTDLAEAKKEHYVTEFCRGKSISRAEVDGAWHFLTGSEDNIRKLTDAVGFHYRWDPKFEEYAHPSGLVILTPQGKVTRYFFGINYEPYEMRLSLVEASHNQIGGLAEQILLYCYHYDPSTGRYSLAVMRAVKIGGVLILVGIGGLFYWLRRLSKRRTAVAAAGPGTDGGAAETRK